MFIESGFRSVINSEQILMLLDYDSNFARTYVQKAKLENKVIKAAGGRRTRTVILLKEGLVVLSSHSSKWFMTALKWISSPSV